MTGNGTSSLASHVAIAAHTSRAREAEALAQNLELEIVDAHSKKHNFHLILAPDRLELSSTRHTPRLRTWVDFVGGKTGYRQRHGTSIRQAIARAIGIRGPYRPKVIDATLGLGKDAFTLASLGCHVTGVERSPIVAALVHDGLMRASKDHLSSSVVSERMQLVISDAASFLEHINDDRRPDVIYLDPMFPQRSKSALVKKDMQLLQQLLETDTDSVQLLDIALSKANRRVVVKRPRLAPPIEGPKPQSAIVGKTTRFDIYPRVPPNEFGI